MVQAVRYGAPEEAPEYTQTLAKLKTRITTAAASDDHAGERITDASRLRRYYRSIGAYGGIIPGDGETVNFRPAQPPGTYSCAGGTAGSGRA